MYRGERFNAYSHWLGGGLAIIGLLAMQLSPYAENPWKRVSVSIYGGTMVLLYLMSALYHSVAKEKIKRFFQHLDHLSIYLLIAGTYTPFALISLRGPWGWSILGTVWGLAVLGMAQEFLVRSASRRLSLVMYLLMGWVAVVAIVPLWQRLPAAGLAWLFAGGLFYTVGVYWYVHDERIRHGHGIWHLFVLAGSLCHFLCIYGWVLPN